MYPGKTSDYHPDSKSMTAYANLYYSESAIMKIKRGDVKVDFQKP